MRLIRRDRRADEGSSHGAGSGTDPRALTGSGSSGTDERAGGRASNAPKPAPWPSGVSQELRPIARRPAAAIAGIKYFFMML